MVLRISSNNDSPVFISVGRVVGATGRKRVSPFPMTPLSLEGGSHTTGLAILCASGVRHCFPRSVIRADSEQEKLEIVPTQQPVVAASPAQTGSLRIGRGRVGLIKDIRLLIDGRVKPIRPKDTDSEHRTPFTGSR